MSLETSRWRGSARERQVGREPVVSDVSEVSGGAIPVRDDESAFNVALNELVLVECWFIVTLTWRIHPPMARCWRVKTPDLGVLWRARGLGGVVVPVYTDVPGVRGVG